MKKILFILGMYYPKYSANGLCTKNVVDELIKNGYDVSCICNGNRKSKKQECVDGARLYYIKPRLHQIVNDKANAVTNKRSKYFLQKIGIVLGKIQLVLTSFSWPLVSPLYAFNFYRKAIKIHQKDEYDAIVAVYTPFESLLSGYWLKRKYPEIKFIPYYLDTLAGGWGPSFFSQARTEKHTRKWEKRIDKVADFVISMHSSEKYHVSAALCLQEKRIFLDVPVMKTPYVCDKEEPFALYAGNLNYKGRDISKLLNIFSELSSRTEIKILLAGGCNDTKIFEYYAKKTHGKIQYLGMLEHEAVLELEKRAKYLINLASINPYTIPSKIFEYMRFGKTIISTYQTEKDPSIEYLNKYKNVIYIDERLSVEESAERLLKEMCAERKTEVLELEKVFYYNTPKAFVDVIRTRLK